MLRGLKADEVVDPALRIDAIRKMEAQEERLAKLRSDLGATAWIELGPNPIPNGQVETLPSTAASGRVISIAVHPTNPDIVYVGSAQGGLYRSTNGGTNWTRLLDSALSLAIGAIAIAPSQPDTIYVGTGEENFSADSFFGVGVYRIDNASTASPIVTGPLNDDAVNADIFTGRAIGEIIVHPTDPATIFVASGSGIGGIGSAANNVLPSRGLYRSTDATSADPTFTKLAVASALPDNFSIRDIKIDPTNPNILIANVVATNGGIYRSIKALAVTPAFANVFLFAAGSGGTNNLTAEFASIHPVANPDATFYAAVGNNVAGTGTGRLLISINGGATWIQTVGGLNFCSRQCFYDIAVAVDPTNAANVYLGGSPSLVFGRSNNSGLTFTADGANFTAGLHVDTHVIAVAPSNPAVVYLGTDGGIYRTSNVSATPIVWTSLNNSQFTATQFISLAVHPIDPNFTIGGTQDNGTNYFRPDATWTRSDFGDGGYAVVDQSALNTVVTNMYHTYFNAVNLQGYAFNASPATAFENWAFRGCQIAGATTNGITCTGTVLFYAPLEQGPGTSNTIYYGSDRLYRSADTGLTHTVVSQNPITTGVPISAIGISPQNDNVRIVGQSTGGIFGTTTGSAVLANLDPANSVPNNFIARAVVDPNNVNRAYVTLSAFGVTNVWRTDNLNAAPPTWIAASGTGLNVLPQVPVSAFIVDPMNSNRLYVGTDIGVYGSGDGGVNWFPFNTGLPRVAVFDIKITPAAPRMIRIATHGRGLWQIPALSPSAANVSVAGRVFTPSGRGIPRVLLTITDSQGVSRQTRTNPFGYFRFDSVQSGESYFISAFAKGYEFQSQVISVDNDIGDLDITADTSP